MNADADLLDVLATIRGRGAIGERSLTAAVEHARRFVALLPHRRAIADDQQDAAADEPPLRLVDLGSGGGLPGLVIAVDRPDLAITLVERRTSRADLLRRAVSALSLGHVTVEPTDVADLARRVGRTFDVVTARSFGPPAAVLGAAALVGRPGALVLVSEPPQAGTRWSAFAGVEVGPLTCGIQAIRLLDE